MTRAPRMCDAAPHSCLCSLLAPRFLGCESLVEGKPENLSLEIRPAFEDHHATQKRSSKSDALFGTFMPRRRATSHTTCAFVCVSVATQYNPTKQQNNNQKMSIEIWLILPVVICLFQGLSHACLRITALQESAHGSLHQT
jgi:hypothetical protein